MSRSIKVPLRKCVACQEMRPKKELIRVVKTPQNEVFIDITGKKVGRGAYLCVKLSCFKLVHRCRSLDRTLKQRVNAEIYGQLAQDFLSLKERADNDE